MRTIAFRSFVLGALAALTVGPSAFAGLGQVVASFAAPAANPSGLAWAKGDLYCFCETSPYLIWKVNPNNGKVLGSFKFAKAGADTVGLAHDGKYLWAGNGATDVVYRLEWGGSVAASFKAGWNVGRGFTWSGFHLWGTERSGEPPYSYFQIRVDGKVLKSFTNYYEIYDPAWDGRYLWVPEYDDFAKKFQVVAVDVSNGTGVASFTAPAEEARGSTYDGSYLWLGTAAGNGRLWKVDVRGIGVAPDSLGRVKVLFK
ncbi:MAG: hypothetical protein GTN49_02095 [candidate division Zixibacteria bacterium]|nr:hypothetical protein [candidate division Zixibacteria bacterium]